MISSFDCKGCGSAIFDPVDACPACGEHFFWRVVPKRKPSKSEEAQFVIALLRAVGHDVSPEFLTHGGHIWLPDQFWRTDPEGALLRPYDWIASIEPHQHVVSNGAVKTDESEQSLTDAVVSEADHTANRQPADHATDQQPGDRSGVYFVDEDSLYDSDDDDPVDGKTAEPDSRESLRTGDLRIAHRATGDRDDSERMIVDEEPAKSDDEWDTKPMPIVQPDAVRESVAESDGADAYKPSERSPMKEALFQAEQEREVSGSVAPVARKTVAPPLPSLDQRVFFRPVMLFIFIFFLTLSYLTLCYHRNQLWNQQVEKTTAIEGVEDAVLP
ncbi:hypothetical protein SCOR_20035 [Sulfidibacter corallicola]|uniref:Uncharacterized protein n=1 Tax=Sulfidibacter corallicola TaxID=2818388 RepID=A0A8A4TTG9_SULCO|nr:hypothetical protein [Sulfidibacter corallicola]QTD53266.1 hypothetical protein J3U87_12495 [Sulfidibacter corallicola]